MGRKSRFSSEVRERAVRLVGDHRSQYGSQWEAIQSIAEKIGCSAETLRKWVRRAGDQTLTPNFYGALLSLFQRGSLASLWRYRLRQQTLTGRLNDHR